MLSISPTEEDMSDEALKDAMQELPSRAIVVIEDVDALFTPSRQTKVRLASSPHNLNFTGLTQNLVNSKALIEIFSQTAGSTCEFWVNPVNFTFQASASRGRWRTG
jgi:hypothetical protein